MRAHASSAEAVEAFVTGLEQPWREALQALRPVIGSVSDSIEEGIKWNALSFRTSEWFATVNSRNRTGETRLWLILHAGAKAGPDLRGALDAVDTTGILEWLGRDRALVTFADAAEVRRRSTALKRVIRAWIERL